VSYTDPLPLLQPEDSAKEKTEEDDEEKIKNQIHYDRLIQKHPGNKIQINFILSQMREMLSESGDRILLNSGHYEKTKSVKERLLQISYEDIENL
jgi:hypothetical protein